MKVLLKDVLFNKAKVEKIASEIQHVFTSFDKKLFIRQAIGRFPELELKERIAWIAQCLQRHLPADPRRAIGIMLKALPPPNNPLLSDDDFGDFIYAPYAEYVAQHGCTRDLLRFSLEALREITQRFSAEDAIRYFLNAFPKETLDTLLGWCQDPHYHVRRLCSEGTRPALPWSKKITVAYTVPLPILDRLFFDKTRYVTRSVANHLNDVSKRAPDEVFARLSRWRKSGKQNPDEMDFICRHALRTLIKKGHPRAIGAMGCSPSPRLRVSGWVVPKRVPINSFLEFSLTLNPLENLNAIIDYIIYFKTKSGKAHGQKVFKWSQCTLKKRRPVVLSKRHFLREHMTTRTLYRGRHELEIKINGKSFGKKSFCIF